MTESLFVAFYSRLHYPYLEPGPAGPRQIVRKIKPAGGERVGNCIKGGSEETLLCRLNLLLSDKDSPGPWCQDPRMSYDNDDTETKREIISF